MRVTGLVLLAALLAGCAAGTGIGPAATGISIRAAADANFGHAVAVDIVAVHDAALVERLNALSAAQWFERRPQMLVQWSQRGLAAWSFEVAPGTRLQGPQAVIYDEGAQALFVYAQYFSPGEHRWRVSPQRALQVELSAEDFTVTQP